MKRDNIITTQFFGYGSHFYFGHSHIYWPLLVGQNKLTINDLRSISVLFLLFSFVCIIVFSDFLFITNLRPLFHKFNTYMYTGGNVYGYKMRCQKHTESVSIHWNARRSRVVNWLSNKDRN